MPMNEYGEIIRSENNENSAQNQQNCADNRSIHINTDMHEQFRVSNFRNFNIITLAICIPLYAVLGYFLAEYFQFESITPMMGCLIGAGCAAICVLFYNNVIAKKYEGIDYLLSVTSTAIVGVGGYIILQIVAAIIAVIIAVIVIVAVLKGLIDS